MPTSRRAPGFPRSPLGRFVLQVALGATIVLGLIAALVACASNPQGTENFGSTSSALAVSGLFATGVDGTGVPLAIGSIDPHYTLSSDDPTRPGPNALVVAPVVGWIRQHGDLELAQRAGQRVRGEPRQLHLHDDFTLAGVDPTTATISGIVGVRRLVRHQPERDHRRNVCGAGVEGAWPPSRFQRAAPS